MPEYQKKENLEERDIVLEIIKEVAKKFLVEFRSGNHKRIVHHGNWSEEIEEPDAREEAIQGVDLATSLLRPHFNDKKAKTLGMNIKYGKFIEKRKELLGKFEESKITEDIYTRDRLVLARDWFGEILMLLGALKYLKKGVVVG